jgi:flagellar assembly factor FliW
VELEKSDFEKHMKQFKSAMEQTGATTQMKLQELEHWFGDLALVVVERFVLRNDYEQAYSEAITALTLKGIGGWIPPPLCNIL